MKITYLLIVCILASVIFADIGPGPEPVVIKLNLLENGKPYTGEATAIYQCSLATERGPPKGSVEPGDKQMECFEGKCNTAGWYYKFNPCFHSKGNFSVTANGKTIVSPEISLEDNTYYVFDFDLATNQITKTDGSGEIVNPPGPDPEPNPSCIPGIALVAIAFLATVAVKK
jgi:hypothetical protein